MYILFSGTFLSLQDKEENDEFIQSWGEQNQPCTLREKLYYKNEYQISV